MPIHLNPSRVARMFLAVAVVGAMGAGLQAQEGEPAILALNKPATISSTSKWTTTLHPTGANDGNVKKDFGFHTADQGTQWWKVDLQAVKEIGMIKVFNRLGGYQDRAKNLKIYYSQDDRTYTAIPRQDDGQPFDTLALNINNGQGVKARYVKVELSDGNPLHLAQVEVFEKLQLKAPDPNQVKGPDAGQHGMDPNQAPSNPFGNM